MDNANIALLAQIAALCETSTLRNVNDNTGITDEQDVRRALKAATGVSMNRQPSLKGLKLAGYISTSRTPFGYDAIRITLAGIAAAAAL